MINGVSKVKSKMNKWQIKDLKGVGDVELNLDGEQRVFVLFGGNGIGKTKTLESIFVYLMAKNLVFNDFHFLIKNKIASNIEYNKCCLDLNYNDEMNLYILFQQFEQKEQFAMAFLASSLRSSIDNNFYTSSIFGDLKSRQETYLTSIGNHIINNDFSKIGMSENVRDWFVERAKSVNIYQKEEDNRQSDINSVLKALNDIDPRIDKKLSIDANGKAFFTIENQERELGELSSGFLSIVKIIQSIISSYSAFTNEKDLLNIKGVVLIDEIESHLHLEWQIKIIPILKNLFPNTTFYITTHSPLVLSQLNEGEAYLLKRDADNVVRSHLINSPNTRLLENVLQDTFGVNLNELKRQNMANIDQSKAKKKLLDLLNGQVS